MIATVLKVGLAMRTPPTPGAALVSRFLARVGKEICQGFDALFRIWLDSNLTVGRVCTLQRRGYIIW